MNYIDPGIRKRLLRDGPYKSAEAVHILHTILEACGSVRKTRESIDLYRPQAGGKWAEELELCLCAAFGVNNPIDPAVGITSKGLNESKTATTNDEVQKT